MTVTEQLRLEHQVQQLWALVQVNIRFLRDTVNNPQSISADVDYACVQYQQAKRAYERAANKLNDRAAQRLVKASVHNLLTSTAKK